MMGQINKTIEYYNKNAEKFVQGTANVDFTDNQNGFISALQGKSVLDFGCGSGRDAKYFADAGLDVDAVDGSEELCKIAAERLGRPVKQMMFDELTDEDKYDGIWACSSILHLPKDELIEVLGKMINALHMNGVIYTSFKYGNFEGERNGRYFTDFTYENFAEFIKPIDRIIIEEYWITGDVRPGREDEKWLNVLLRKTSF